MIGDAIFKAKLPEELDFDDEEKDELTPHVGVEIQQAQREARELHAFMLRHNETPESVIEWIGDGGTLDEGNQLERRAKRYRERVLQSFQRVLQEARAQ